MFATNRTTDTLPINGLPDLDLMLIAPGEFLMGSAHGFPLELPVHRVRLSHSFLIGRFPVTQAQWTAVMESNPSSFSGSGDLPVEGVSWEDAQCFVQNLAARTGRGVRLPTEAEWEYACGLGLLGSFSLELTMPSCVITLGLT
jgi:formylglycine-generating enzyme required for sulfatase activity